MCEDHDETVSLDERGAREEGTLQVDALESSMSTNESTQSVE